MEDLWPKDISSETKLKAPVTILKEQGPLLGEKTKNIVFGVAARDRETVPDSFCYSFLILAKAIGYSYQLFRTCHKIVFYPVKFTMVDDDILKELAIVSKHSLVSAKNEEEFKNLLNKIFNTEKTKRIISAILAQSEAVIH